MSGEGLQHLEIGEIVRNQCKRMNRSVQRKTIRKSLVSRKPSKRILLRKKECAMVSTAADHIKRELEIAWDFSCEESELGGPLVILTKAALVS